MRIGFGCVKLGSASSGHSWRTDVRLVREAVDRGVTVFDTADVYGSGASEQVLGRALDGRRSQVTIATKGGYRFRPRTLAEQSARRSVALARKAVSRQRYGGGWGAAEGGGGAYEQKEFSAPYLRTAVEASLRRLRTDHIDLYQLHGPPHVVPDLFEQLHDIVASGKVARFGIGAESVDAAVDWMPVAGVEVAQLPFGVLDPEAATDAFPVAERHGVEVWARGVLGGGLFAVAVSDSTPILDHPKRKVIKRLQELAGRHDIGVDRLAVGFVQSYPQVSTMLLGVSKTSHLHRNLSLFDAGPLDADLLTEVHDALRTRDATDG